MFTVFEIIAHCRPVTKQPAMGRQHHQVTCREQDDIHFDSPDQEWEASEAALLPTDSVLVVRLPGCV